MNCFDKTTSLISPIYTFSSALHQVGKNDIEKLEGLLEKGDKVTLEFKRLYGHLVEIINELII